MAVSFTTLISAPELAKYINDPNWVILDCRHDLADPNAGRAAYAEGHIPSARFAHLDFDLSGNKLNEIGAFCGRHPLPDREVFIAKLRTWGINNNTQVIAYDGQGGIFAARLWWMLRWVGHAQVAVLDGGYPAWLAANLAITTGAPVARQGTLHEQAPLVRMASVGDVQANIQSGLRTLVDARSPDRFRGENETLDPIGGHIPGARNRFFKDNLQENGCFKSAEQLHQEWSAVVADSRNAIMQCGSGVTACHNLLALEVAGLTGAALYAGSWSEWCIDPRRPIALGPD
ncbi:thiosulfate/3-mercaptopyruvate sulfurtransferase [Oxalobacteraceae bacterium GrIS 2.11]